LWLISQVISTGLAYTLDSFFRGQEDIDIQYMSRIIFVFSTGLMFVFRYNLLTAKYPLDKSDKNESAHFINVFEDFINSLMFISIIIPSFANKWQTFLEEDLLFQVPIILLSNFTDFLFNFLTMRRISKQ